MKKILLFLFVIALIFNSLESKGQLNRTIKGTVLDSISHEALAFASIYSPTLKIGCISGKDGKFKLENLPEGRITLMVKYQGYLDFEKTIDINDINNQEVNFLMKLEIKELLGVEIKNENPYNHSFSSLLVKKSSIEESSVRDIGELLKIVPNVHAVRKGGANLDPVIRGFKFDQLNVMVDDGMSVEGGCPNRMDPTTSHVEAEDIEAIEIQKGPFALRWGANMGGVINLKTLNPRPFDTFQVHFKANLAYESNWNGNRQHYVIMGGGKKVYFVATANNSVYGDYKDGEGKIVPSQFRKFGGTAKLGFSLTKNQSLYVSYSEFYARNIAFPTLPMDERADNTKLYSVDYNFKNINDKISSITFKAYLTDVDHTMDNYERAIADTSAVYTNILAQRLGYRAEIGLNVWKGHIFAGTDFYDINKDGERVKNMIGQKPNGLSLVPTKIEALWNKANLMNNGIFAEYQTKHGVYEYVGSLRFDYNRASGDSILLNNTSGVNILRILPDSTKSEFINFSASLGITRFITEKLSLGFSIGRGTRSPNILERFIVQLPVGLDNFEYVGNPLLKPETNNELDILLKYNDFQLGAFEFTTFYSLIQNYIDGEYLPKSVVMPLTLNVIGVKRFENTGNASLYGFEFGYKSPVQYKLQIGLTAAISQGIHHQVLVYTFDASNNATGSELVKNDPLSEIPPFNLNLYLTYSLYDGKLTPKMNYRFMAKQNRVSAAQFEIPSDASSVFNFSINYKQSQNLSIVGGVTNLFNTTYYEHLNRRILGTNLRFNEPGRVFYANLIVNI